MPLILNREELTTLIAFRDQGLELPDDTVGSFTGGYTYLVRLIKGQQDMGGVSPAALIWLEGAIGVNAGTGSAADFIREYTRQQYKIRYGEELPQGLLQTASNDIAAAVLNTVIQSSQAIATDTFSLTVPSIDVIATLDAGPMTARIFGGDQAAWAGDPLFLSLGHHASFDNDILPNNTGDTYNLLAMIKATSSAASVLSWQSNIQNFWNLVDNNINLSSYSVLASSAANALAGFNATYGTDTALVFQHIIGSNIVLGNVEHGGNLDGTVGNDIYCGGDWADSFHYSAGYDLMDGGIGVANEANFSDSPTSVQISLGGAHSASYALWTGEALFSNADQVLMYNIQRVVGTSLNDNFLIFSLPVTGMHLNGGVGFDTLSTFAAQGAVIFDDTDKLLYVGDKFIGYINFESLNGTPGSDIFRLNHGGMHMKGDDGNDFFLVENYTADLNGAVLDGGTGANIIETGDYADISGATLTNLQTLQVNGFYGLVNMSVAQLNGFSAINAVGGNAVIGLTTGGAYNLGNLSVTGAIMVQALTTEALTATGTSGDDTMSGWDSVDATLYGMGGNDTLFTGTGHNHIYGGAGNDTIVVQSGLLSLGDVLDGEAGVNTLDVAAHTDLSLATLRNLQKLTVDTDAMLTVTQFNLFVQYLAYGGSATLQAKTPGTYNLSGKTTSGRISLKGSTGGDVLVGDAKAQTLDGGAGLDQLTGGGGADIFKFSALTDSQYPGAMDLIADFTIGTDKIDVSGLGFTGVTTGTAGAGQLKVRYDSYYNYTYVYDTGTGFGFYMAGNKSALTAADFIGLPPSATVTISGTAGNDVLTGSNANDLLLGYAGADQLIGNSGNDVLDGGAGVDQLTGGAGMDVFRFTTLADSIFASGMDRIADFVKGEDRIDLTGLGFTGVTTGTPMAGQLKLSFDAFYNQTYLRDLNGTGFGLYLTGNQTAITNSDMVGLV